MKKRIAIAAVAIVAALAAALWGSSSYMLGYSLEPDPNRRDTDSTYALLCKWVPT